MIRLEEITNENIWAVAALTPAEDQMKYAPSNVTSLLEAFATINEGGTVKPLAVYNDWDLVGFIMIGKGFESRPEIKAIAGDNYVFQRLMIDEHWQNQGLAPQILQAGVDYARSFPFGPADSILLSVAGENEKAAAIYKEFGFVENGKNIGDEVIEEYKLEPIAAEAEPDGASEEDEEETEDEINFEIEDTEE